MFGAVEKVKENRDGEETHWPSSLYASAFTSASSLGASIAIAVEWQSFSALATSCRFALMGPSSWCAVPIPSLMKAWATVASVLKAAQRRGVGQARSFSTARASMTVLSIWPILPTVPLQIMPLPMYRSATIMQALKSCSSTSCWHKLRYVCGEFSSEDVAKRAQSQLSVIVRPDSTAPACRRMQICCTNQGGQEE
jgi:hypothetical protein